MEESWGGEMKEISGGDRGERRDETRQKTKGERRWQKEKKKWSAKSKFAWLLVIISAMSKLLMLWRFSSSLDLYARAPIIGESERERATPVSMEKGREPLPHSISYSASSSPADSSFAPRSLYTCFGASAAGDWVCCMAHVQCVREEKRRRGKCSFIQFHWPYVNWLTVIHSDKLSSFPIETNCATVFSVAFALTTHPLMNLHATSVALIKK